MNALQKITVVGVAAIFTLACAGKKVVAPAPVSPVAAPAAPAAITQPSASPQSFAPKKFKTVSSPTGCQSIEERKDYNVSRIATFNNAPQGESDLLVMSQANQFPDGRVSRTQYDTLLQSPDMNAELANKAKMKYCEEGHTLTPAGEEAITGQPAGQAAPKADSDSLKPAPLSEVLYCAAGNKTLIGFKNIDDAVVFKIFVTNGKRLQVKPSADFNPDDRFKIDLDVLGYIDGVEIKPEETVRFNPDQEEDAVKFADPYCVKPERQQVAEFHR